MRKGSEEMRSKLKEARQKAGMTQQQMADYLHIGLRPRTAAAALQEI